MEKGAVIAALSLYLDFINIFLFMLRLFGGRDYGDRPDPGPASAGERFVGRRVQRAGARVVAAAGIGRLNR